jgi:hypothetical protein
MHQWQVTKICRSLQKCGSSWREKCCLQPDFEFHCLVGLRKFSDRFAIIPGWDLDLNHLYMEQTQFCIHCAQLEIMMPKATVCAYQFCVNTQVVSYGKLGSLACYVVV